MIIDTRELLTRNAAAQLYGGCSQTMDYLVRVGHLRPVFVMGHTRLFLRRDVLAVKRMNLRPGRPASLRKPIV